MKKTISHLSSWSSQLNLTRQSSLSRNIFHHEEFQMFMDQPELTTKVSTGSIRFPPVLTRSQASMNFLNMGISDQVTVHAPVSEVQKVSNRVPRASLQNTSQSAFAETIIAFLQAQHDHSGSDKDLFSAVCSLLTEECMAKKNAYTPRRCFRSALRPMLADGTIKVIQTGPGKKGKAYKWISKGEKLRELQAELEKVRQERDMWKDLCAKQKRP